MEGYFGSTRQSYMDGIVLHMISHFCNGPPPGCIVFFKGHLHTDMVAVLSAEVAKDKGCDQRENVRDRSMVQRKLFSGGQKGWVGGQHDSALWPVGLDQLSYRQKGHLKGNHPQRNDPIQTPGWPSWRTTGLSHKESCGLLKDPQICELFPI